MLQGNYLTGNLDSIEKEEICAVKQKVNTLKIQNNFLRNDVVSKQNLIDYLLEHNSNLFNHQCCRAIQDTQSNVRSGINTDVTDIYYNNHGVYTNTNDKANEQINSYKKNDKATVHRDNSRQRVHQ